MKNGISSGLSELWDELSPKQRSFLTGALLLHNGQGEELEDLLASMLLMASPGGRIDLENLLTCPQTVRIRVEGGVAFVDECPEGVLVEITDYDVAPSPLSQFDHSGRRCAKYSPILQ